MKRFMPVATNMSCMSNFTSSYHEIFVVSK